MSAIMPVLRAIAKDELAAVRPLSLGVVTRAFTNEGGAGDNNLAVDLRIRGSALELHRVPVAVGRIGASHAPRVGDLALVGFVDGNLNGGVVLGFLYDEQNRAPDAKPTEVVYVVPDDEESGIRRASIQLPNGNVLSVEDTAVTVTMGGTTMKIEADGAITLEAAGDLVFKAKGAVTIEATGAASLKGSSVSIEGQSQAKLKGAMTTIAGITNFTAG